MTLIERTACHIEFLNDKGVGVGKTILGIVELPYTLPKELVEFERHKYRGQTHCILKNVIKPSPARVAPICKYFGTCGGCMLQHLTASDYAKFKFDTIKNLLNKANICSNLKPMITIPFGNRRRANLEVLKKNNKIYLGFHRFHAQQIIDIDDCPALLSSLSSLLRPLKHVADQILANKQKAQIFLNQASNGPHILFKIKESLSFTNQQLQLLKNFAKQHKISNITFSLAGYKTTIYQTQAPYISFNNISVGVEADSFLQASCLAEQILLSLVLDFFNNSNKLKEQRAMVVDLFCGRGTFTIPISQYFNIDGFDLDREALLALKLAAISANLAINLEHRNLFTTPLSGLLLSKYNYAIINPPRAGARAQCLAITNSTIEKIAYISCNCVSFIDDAQILITGGYKLTAVTPIDQFPLTAHLEIAGLFSKTT